MAATNWNLANEHTAKSKVADGRNVINLKDDEMKHSVVSMSNAAVGKAFNAIVKGIGRDDLGEILLNWNDSELNEDGDKIIGYPGRDRHYSHGKEGGKVTISKREFLDWLRSEKPFDEKVYGAEIRNNTEWTSLIHRAQEAAVIKSPLRQPATTTPILDESIKRMKKEIIEDIKAGRVPVDCPSFAALHDYVDANCYGGFCEGDLMQALTEHFGGIDKDEGMPDALIGYLNDAQNSIDCWIKEGGIQHLA